MRATSIAIVLPVLLAFTANTQQASAAEFDAEKLAAIRGKMQKFVDDAGPSQVSGAVIVVGSSKGIAYHEALGEQNIEGKQPMGKDSLFRIASMTKPITAMGIMIL